MKPFNLLNGYGLTILSPNEVLLDALDNTSKTL